MYIQNLQALTLAFHLQRDPLVAVLRRQVLHLTQILLHCYFATDWRRDLTGQVVRAPKEPSFQGLAAHHRWPIRLDHCFMRVCLDAAVGTPWSDMIGRPAVRTMSDAQLAAAIAVGERIVREPACLPTLNAASLQGRRRAKRSLTAA